MMFSTIAVLVCLPTNSGKVFLFSTSLPTFVFFSLLDNSHSKWGEVVSLSFDLHFLEISDGEHFLKYLLAMCVFF
jgi:hypothetical protein